MDPRTLLLVLVAACSVQTLNAWLWDRTTTTTEAPVMSRKKFLSLLSQAADSIAAEVAESQRLAKEGVSADIAAQAEMKAKQDVSAYSERFTKDLNHYVARVKKTSPNVDTAPCVSRYMDDKAATEAYLMVQVKDMLQRDMQDVRDTAAKASALLDTIAAVAARGRAEAARPDGQYGGNVEAILKDADKAVAKAQWNNAHIKAELNGFTFVGETVMAVHGAAGSLSAALDYADLCIERLH